VPSFFAHNFLSSLQLLHVGIFWIRKCSHTSSEPQSWQSAKLCLQSSELGLPQPLTRRNAVFYNTWICSVPWQLYCTLYIREYWMIYWGPSFSPSYDLAPFPSPIYRPQVVSLSLPVCRRLSILTGNWVGGGGEGGEKKIKWRRQSLVHY